MQCYDAWRNDISQSKWDYAVCMKWCWNVILSLENKSLTSAEEFWETESRMIVGDEEYAHLSRPCLECFHWGFMFLLFEENSAGECWLCLRKTLWRVLIPAWGRKFRSLSCPFLYWGVISWWKIKGVNNLLGTKKLTVSWLSSRFCSNSLGVIEKFTGEEELWSLDLW